jgi:hypothetical protein
MFAQGSYEYAVFDCCPESPRVVMTLSRTVLTGGKPVVVQVYAFVFSALLDESVTLIEDVRPVFASRLVVETTPFGSVTAITVTAPVAGSFVVE